LHITDNTANWAANKNWNNMQYILQQFGSKRMKAKVMTSTTRDDNGQRNYGYDRFIFDVSHCQVQEVQKDMKTFLEEKAGMKDVVLKDSFTPAGMDDKDGALNPMRIPDTMKMMYLENTLSPI
jgi:hypothetical protein